MGVLKTWDSYCMLSYFRRVWLFATRWTVAHQAPLSMWFSRQEYWSAFLWPPPGYLPDQWTESPYLASPTLAGGFFTTSTTCKKTLEIPLDSKEIKPVNPKGNQPWIFIGRTDAKAEAPILWPPDAKNRLGKDPDAGETEGRRTDRRQRTRWSDSTTNSMDMRLSKVREMVKERDVLQPLGSRRVGHDWATEEQQHFYFHPMNSRLSMHTYVHRWI